MNRSEEIKVFISGRAESKCDECGEDLEPHAWITLDREKGALCLSCGDLDQLVFLPSGDAALTRRAKKHSVLSAVVLKWSRARKRYERQGLLVEENALQQAEAECLADSEVRARRGERERERRAEVDCGYLDGFAKRIRELFPGCPAAREFEIGEHACRKYSGRVGRSAAAKSFDEEAVRLAVIAHIRHRETNYDTLLGTGWDRHDARHEVRERVEEVLRNWLRPLEPLELPEGARLDIIVVSRDKAGQNGAAAASILAVIAALPLEASDVFSGNEHDSVLYPEKPTA